MPSSRHDRHHRVCHHVNEAATKLPVFKYALGMQPVFYATLAKKLKPLHTRSNHAVHVDNRVLL